MPNLPPNRTPALDKSGFFIDIWQRYFAHLNNSLFSDGETPAGLVNGVNTVFTLQFAPNPVASLQVFVSGALVTAYTLSGKTITFTVAPIVGSTIRAWYRY